MFWTPDEISHNTVIDIDRRQSPTLRHIPGNFAAILALFLIGLLRLCFARDVFDPSNGEQPDRRHRLEISILLLAFILIFFLSYLPFFNAAHYRVPLLPFLMLFGAVGLAGLARSARQGRYGRSLAWIAAGIALYFVTSRPLVHYESPGLAVWHLVQARGWSESGHLERAVDETRAALAIDPDNIDTHELLANVLKKMNRVDEARRVESKIPRLRERRADQILALATALAQRGRIDDALWMIDEARQTAPRYFALYSRAAEILTAGDRLEEAIAYARQAVDLEPESLRDRCRLGELLLRLERPREAESEFREALRQNPNLQPARDGLKRATALQAGPAKHP